MDELSGYEPPVIPTESELVIPASALKMLSFVAECYLPFLHANDAALVAGQDQLCVEIFGGETSGIPRVEHSQPPFKYQRRCLRLLKEQYDRLQGEEREFVRETLASVGGLWLFEAGASSRL
jgi:hypothetical protein